MVHVHCQYGKEVALDILGFATSHDGVIIATDSGGVFCWSRAQAQEVVRNCTRLDKVQDLEENMKTAGLPEGSDQEPIEIDKDSASTILGIMQDLGHFFGISPGDMTVFTNIPTGRPYYAFGPTSINVKSALVGWSNPADEHFMAIYYSQTQARHLIRKRFSWMSSTARRKLQENLQHAELPHASDRDPVVLTGSLVGWLNSAYHAKMDAIRRAGPAH